MIKIICVGKIKEKQLDYLVSDYLKKISFYHKIQVIEVKDFPGENDPSYPIKQEGSLICQKINEKDFVILLDIKGKSFDSVQLAQEFEHIFNQTVKDIIFIIGGSYGVSDEIKQRANLLWSFSKLTFPHQLVRLLLTEQIFRICKINSGQKYHK